MKTGSSVIGSVLLVAIVILASGCAEIGPVHRQPVNVAPLHTSLPPNDARVLVGFESTVPSAPLRETVWDNKHGAFADAEGSKWIGFVMAWSPATGMAANLAPNNTRIVIPFGRILQGVLESGLQKVFPNSLTISGDSFPPEKIQSFAPSYTVTVRVKDFELWERPLNHINLRATVHCSVCRSDGTRPPKYVCDVRHELTNQPLGSIFQTSSGLVREMNRISNEMAASVSEDILNKVSEIVEN